MRCSSTNTLTSDGVDLARPRETRTRFQDLVRAAQLEHLATQLADLLTLLARQQIAAATLVRFDLADILAQRLRRQPEISSDVPIGRPDSNTSRVARSNSSTGYFLALGMTDLSFRQADPGNEVSVKTGMAQTGRAI